MGNKDSSCEKDCKNVYKWKTTTTKRKAVVNTNEENVAVEIIKDMAPIEQSSMVVVVVLSYDEIDGEYKAVRRQFESVYVNMFAMVVIVVGSFSAKRR